MSSSWSSKSLGSLCDQLLNIMTPGNVEKSSFTLTFHIGIPQGYMLSPLHSLFLHDYVAVHSSTPLSSHHHHQDDNPDTLRLNVIKPKELIVDYRKQQVGGRIPLASGGQQWRPLAASSSYGFTSLSTNIIAERAGQTLVFLHRLKKTQVSLQGTLQPLQVDYKEYQEYHGVHC